MPDTKGYDTPFKDYVHPKPSFEIKPTLGDKPSNFPVTDSGVSGAVKPVELPENTLWHGPKS